MRTILGLLRTPYPE